MKKDFYVFLDIDGVLWDWKFIREMVESGKLKRGGLINTFNPQSIRAIDNLLYGLEKQYNVQLVLSSTWRYEMHTAIKTLKRNGFEHYAQMDTTPITRTPEHRGLEILKYLEDKQKPYDFLVIDDEMYDFADCFDLSHLIKTSMVDASLSQSQVDAFLQEKTFDGVEL